MASPAVPGPDGKLPLIERLSPSRALDFKKCPQAFYYRAIEKRSDPATVHTARGTLVHAACEKAFDLERGERTPENIIKILHEEWPEMRTKDAYKHLFAEPVLDGSMPKGGDEAEFLQSCELMVRNWFVVEDPAVFDPDDRERWLKAEIEGVPLIGVLDRAARFGEGGLSITDYKTGKAPKPRYEEEAFFGLKVYAAMYREITGQTPTHLRLVYLKTPEIKQRRCDDQMCDGIIKELGALWAAIKRAWRTDDWPTKTGPLCNWCAFQDICPAWNDVPVIAAQPEDAA